MVDDAEESTLIADAKALHSLLEERRADTWVTVIAGPQVGRMFKLSGASVVGRSDSADIAIADSEISRKHARLSVEEGHVVVEDLGSTNGTFVNGSRIERHVLEDGDKIQVGTNTVLRFSYQDQLDEQFQRHMYESASRDGLTGAYNKTHFLDRLGSEFAYSVRHSTALALLMFDIDRFKAINDTHGHLAGDRVLKTLADIVSENVRAEDIFARYGGEEFAVISRGNDLAAAEQLASRLRQLVEEHAFVHDGVPISVTISVGVAAVPDAAVGDPIGLVALADEMLYDAKRSGRNQVKVHRGGPR